MAAPLTIRAKLRSGLLGLAILFGMAGIIALGMLLFCSHVPFGYFDSTTLMGHHDSEDVVHFSRGLVHWETCCGDEAVGSFGRAPNGQWIWQLAYGKKRPVKREYILRPGLVHLICTEVGNPTNVFRLRRRLFAPKEAVPFE